MKNNSIQEIYRFVRGVRRTKEMVMFSLPMAVYAVYRIVLVSVFHKHGAAVNKVVFTLLSLLCCVTLALIFKNISDDVRLRRRLSEIAGSDEKNALLTDFSGGSVFLSGSLIIGRSYVFSKGSARLFSFDELSGVFHDIRETYNILTMILSGADDIVKTKIIKAEYRGKNFLHDRRICTIEVHKQYDSVIGTTNGYDQLAFIEQELNVHIAAHKMV